MFRLNLAENENFYHINSFYYKFSYTYGFFHFVREEREKQFCFQEPVLKQVLF